MTPARIMIVEDEQITATDIEDILTHLGHHVVAVVTSVLWQRSSVALKFR